MTLPDPGVTTPPTDEQQDEVALEMRRLLRQAANATRKAWWLAEDLEKQLRDAWAEGMDDEAQTTTWSAGCNASSALAHLNFALKALPKGLPR